MELRPSMADSISSSYESSSDRPLGDALLESDTRNGISPGTYIYLPRGRGVDEMTHPSGVPRCLQEVPEPRAGWRRDRRVPLRPREDKRRPSITQPEAKGRPPRPRSKVSSAKPQGSITPTPLTPLQGGYTTATRSL